MFGGGVSAGNGWRGREVGRRNYQQVTSVVSSERLQTQIMTPVVERGYGCERHWRMSHSFTHSSFLDACSNQVPASHGEFKEKLEDPLIRVGGR